MDDDNNKLLDLSEFKKAVHEMNIDITNKQIRKLFEYFDRDHNGYIDYTINGTDLDAKENEV